jgi:NAD(P)-dependent dehydrogenase (short-subunit alcohol dehydrogenase family)
MVATTHTHPTPFRINNAGTNAYKYGPLLESDDEDLEAIVDTNVLGVMLCCKEVRVWVCACVFAGLSV